MNTILIIDDDRNIVTTLSYHLQDLGLETVSAATGERGFELFLSQHPELVFLDLKLPDVDGLDLLERMLAMGTGSSIVMITAHGSVDTAVAAMKKGAFDYLQKPFGTADVTRLVKVVGKVRSLETEVRELRRELLGVIEEGDLITRNRGMRTILATARQVADSDANVLLTGESGTGKGLLAWIIHSWSFRAEGPYITVDCTALQETLLESDLFGHVKGAFTGAVKNKEGKLSLAQGGTVFLDEVAEMSPTIQSKLLRFLQSREFDPVGSTQSLKVDARVIAATNRDLESMVREATFRQDLYFRLNVVELRLPPLRERTDDIPILAEHYLEKFAKTYKRAIASITDEAVEALQRYPWPGNVRELVNVVERGVVLARGDEISLDDLPEAVRQDPARAGTSPPLTLAELEKEHIRKVLATADSLEEAAGLLGIDPATLWRKRKKFGLG